MEEIDLEIDEKRAEIQAWYDSLKKDINGKLDLKGVSYKQS